MSDFQKESSFDDFERYAQLLDQIEELHFQLMTMLSGDVPKSVYLDGWAKMNDGETKLRSDLEDRLFQEHPEKADIDVFYGEKE